MNLSIVLTKYLKEGVFMNNSQQFIMANTLECTLGEINEKHIIPVHIKDNEPAISHTQFIDAVVSAAKDWYGDVTEPTIRVSHPIKGRIPEARNKPALELLPNESTLYYERMAWVANIPNITTVVDGETLELTIGGVKAYNLDNLYSTKETAELFKVFIGFKNRVCTNLCVSTDGYLSDLKAVDVDQIYYESNRLIRKFAPEVFSETFNAYTSINLSENMFAQVLGKAKLYNAMPVNLKKDIPKLGLTDSQLSMVAEDYYLDNAHCRNANGDINLWKMYNLFTGANKSSYIDTFLERNTMVFKGVEGLYEALKGGQTSWYLN
jgi:hypothetical protein